MAVQKPNVMLAQVMKLTGEVSVTVSDSAGSRTATILAAAVVKYYRVYLAKTADTGTATSAPAELLKAFQAALNAGLASGWTVALDSTGVVSLTYNSTGTGTITWTANGTELRNILGFTGASTGAIAAAGTLLATYAPSGCVLAVSTGDVDTHWKPTASGTAASTTLDGKTYVIDGGYVSLKRDIMIKLLPFTYSEIASGEIRTPAFPTNTAANATYWSSPGTRDYALTPPYSAMQFVYTAHRVAGYVAFSLGELQRQIAGTTTDYEIGSLSAESIVGDVDLFPLSIEGYYGRRDLSLSIVRAASGRVAF